MLLSERQMVEQSEEESRLSFSKRPKSGEINFQCHLFRAEIPDVLQSSSLSSLFRGFYCWQVNQVGMI